MRERRLLALALCASGAAEQVRLDAVMPFKSPYSLLAAMVATRHVTQRNGAVVPALAGGLSGCALDLRATAAVIDDDETTPVVTVYIGGVRDHGWQIVVGPGRSQTLGALSALSQHVLTAHFGYHATATELDNDGAFPNLSRTSASLKAEAVAMATYFVARGWRQVGVLHAADSYGSGYY
jgi:outer membrane PBP1 activator LpoA protein